MYENRSENMGRFIRVMFQANVFGSFLQKRGPSLRIPAISHTQQTAAAALHTPVSLSTFLGAIR